MFLAEQRPGQADVCPPPERGQPRQHQGGAQWAGPDPRGHGVHVQREEPARAVEEGGGGAGGGGSSLSAVTTAAGECSRCKCEMTSAHDLEGDEAGKLSYPAQRPTPPSVCY